MDRPQRAGFMIDGMLTEGLAGDAKEDTAAFAALVARVHGRLETWIAIRLGPKLRERVSEEDVLQETLLHAYRSLEKFKASGAGSFRRWLLSVAENRIRDLSKFHQAQKRDVGREVAQPRTPGESAMLDRFSASITSPSSNAYRSENRRLLAEQIEALPMKLRSVVVARALEERSFGEIAESLGRPVTTVQAQFARGLRTLRDVLSE